MIYDSLVYDQERCMVYTLYSANISIIHTFSLFRDVLETRYKDDICAIWNQNKL